MGSSVGISIDSKSSFAASFPATSESLENSLHKSICYCSVDTELIYRNNRVRDQFNVFFATIEVNRPLTLCFAS